MYQTSNVPQSTQLVCVPLTPQLQHYDNQQLFRITYHMSLRPYRYLVSISCLMPSYSCYPIRPSIPRSTVVLLVYTPTLDYTIRGCIICVCTIYVFRLRLNGPCAALSSIREGWRGRTP